MSAAPLRPGGTPRPELAGAEVRGGNQAGAEAAEGVEGTPGLLIHELKVVRPDATSTYDRPSEGPAARVSRYSMARFRSSQMAGYLAGMAAAGELVPEDLGDADELGRRAAKLRGCGRELKLRWYPSLDQTRLVKGKFCGQQLLCPLCAIRRAAKFLRRYVERLAHVLREREDLRPFLATLTVRDGPDLAERFTHLRSCLRKLRDRRRNLAKGSSRVWTEWARAEGGVGSIEVKRGKNSHQWHPHYHAVLLCDRAPDQKSLSSEWHELTGDSFVVDVRPMGAEAVWREAATMAPVQLTEALADEFVEVVKYALKFSDLSLADNWRAFRVLSGRNLVDAFGCLRGVEVPDGMLDGPLDDPDLAYLEIVFRWLEKEGRYRWEIEGESEGASAVALSSDQASLLSELEGAFSS